MPAEVLLPLFSGSSPDLGGVKLGKTASSKSNRSFDISLKAAHNTLDRSVQQSETTRKPLTQDCLDGSMSQVAYGQGGGIEDAIISEIIPIAEIPIEEIPIKEIAIVEMPIAEMPIREIAIAEMPNTEMLIKEMAMAEPGLLSIVASQPQVPTGSSFNSLSQETQSGMLSGQVMEKPSVDFKVPIPSGNNTLVTKEETAGENAQFSKNMTSGDNQELSKNQTAWRPNSVNLSTTEKSSEPIGLGEKSTITDSRSDTSQSQKVWRGDTSQPSQLIAAETERLRGVTTQGFSNSEGLDATQGLLNSTNSETMVLVDKTVLPEKAISTEDIVDQIVKKMELVSNHKSSAVTIKLEPEFLGKLQINLEVKDNAVVARFSTDNQQVKQLLENGLGQLRYHLEASGIRLEKAEVNVDLGNHSGGFQHFNHSEYQGRQPTPYEASNYYLGQFISDTSPPEIEDNSVQNGQNSDGSINYLI